MTKQPRQPKTPRQRAEETLAVAQRRVDHLTKQHTRLQQELHIVVADLEDAQARLDYVSHDPALKQQPSTTSPSTTNQAGATA